MRTNDLIGSKEWKEYEESKKRVDILILIGIAYIGFLICVLILN